MKKPTYYLWKHEFSTEEEYEEAKAKYRGFGFRIVTYLDGDIEKCIHDGLKTIIKNHIND